MNVVEFFEELADETRNTHGRVDNYPVFFENKEGEEFQIGRIRLYDDGACLILEEKK